MMPMALRSHAAITAVEGRPAATIRRPASRPAKLVVVLEPVVQGGVRLDAMVPQALAIGGVPLPGVELQPPAKAMR